MRALAVAVVALGAAACGDKIFVRRVTAGCTRGDASTAAAPHGLAWPTFHGDRARTGWNASEPVLSPASIAARGLQLAWESPALDEALIRGAIYEPHAYASPLYADDL